MHILLRESVLYLTPKIFKRHFSTFPNLDHRPSTPKSCKVSLYTVHVGWAYLSPMLEYDSKFTTAYVQISVDGQISTGEWSLLTAHTYLTHQLLTGWCKLYGRYLCLEITLYILHFICNADIKPSQQCLHSYTLYMSQGLFFKTHYHHIKPFQLVITK